MGAARTAELTAIKPDHSFKMDVCLIGSVERYKGEDERESLVPKTLYLCIRRNKTLDLFTQTRGGKASIFPRFVQSIFLVTGNFVTLALKYPPSQIHDLKDANLPVIGPPCTRTNRL